MLHYYSMFSFRVKSYSSLFTIRLKLWNPEKSPELHFSKQISWPKWQKIWQKFITVKMLKGIFFPSDLLIKNMSFGESNENTEYLSTFWHVILLKVCLTKCWIWDHRCTTFPTIQYSTTIQNMTIYQGQHSMKHWNFHLCHWLKQVIGFCCLSAPALHEQALRTRSCVLRIFSYSYVAVRKPLGSCWVAVG